MILARADFLAGLRASLPLLVGISPFGLMTGVAMVAGGVPAFEAVAISVLVFAGASMLAMTQLFAAGSPVLLIVAAAFFINLRFMMYSAGLRLHFAALPLRWRLVLAYLCADNAIALFSARAAQHPGDPVEAKFAQYLGAAIPIWVVWQVTVAAGVLLGATLPAAWKLEFAAPLAFIAMSVPFVRDRALLAAAGFAGVTAVLAHGLPLKTGLALAAVAGIAAGLLAERLQPRGAA